MTLMREKDGRVMLFSDRRHGIGQHAVNTKLMTTESSRVSMWMSLARRCTP